MVSARPRFQARHTFAYETAQGDATEEAFFPVVTYIIESAQPLDTPAVAASNFNATVSNTASPSDTPSAGGSFSVNVTASVAAALDAPSAGAVFYATASEVASAQAAAASLLVFGAVVTNSAQALDVVTARYLWEIINDYQASAWAEINNSQSAGWGIINDSQDAGWSTIPTIN